MNHPTYNDGVLKYYKTTPLYDKSKRKIGEEKKYIGCLNYELVYKRQQDYDFAESQSKKLDLKVKVPKRQIDPKYVVEINKEYYECYLCEDSDRLSNYLYLQKVEL